MRLLTALFAAVLVMTGCAYAGDRASGPSDEAIRNILIEKSIRSYQGKCACPYSQAANGSKCGDRSAYSKAGGHGSLCYASDVPDSMVNEYRNADEQIRQILIKRSIRAYKGNCACPYSTMSNGKQCGERSAYSKGGGDRPMCYGSDVPYDAVIQYRRQHF